MWKIGRHGNDSDEAVGPPQSLETRSVAPVQSPSGEGRHQGQSGGLGNEGLAWARAFTEASARRNVQGRRSRLGIDSFE